MLMGSGPERGCRPGGHKRWKAMRNKDSRDTPGDFRNVPDAALASAARALLPVGMGEMLYRAGEPFYAIYAIRSGSFKTIAEERDGFEHVTGFHLPGDVLGLDGVSANIYRYWAVALEDSTVSVLPFHLLETLSQRDSDMQRRIHRLMGAEMARERDVIMMLTMPTDRRMAHFLLDVTHRLEPNRSGKEPARAFDLCMSRAELGSYLGMRLETVSRTLSRFQQEGLITMDGRTIQIIERDALSAL